MSALQTLVYHLRTRTPLPFEWVVAHAADDAALEATWRADYLHEAVAVAYRVMPARERAIFRWEILARVERAVGRAKGRHADAEREYVAKLIRWQRGGREGPSPRMPDYGGSILSSAARYTVTMGEDPDAIATATGDLYGTFSGNANLRRSRLRAWALQRLQPPRVAQILAAISPG